MASTSKVAACAKHFAVHSGPEAIRHSFDAVANPKDMNETYLPAFEAAVKEAKVESVMGAYNRVNGEPACGSKTLLVDILRNKWQFEGHVTSDCWAIRDFHEHHHVTDTAPESAALALKKRLRRQLRQHLPAYVDRVSGGSGDGGGHHDRL